MRGKTALLTGASNGIGTTAVQLAANGVHTIVHCHQGKEEAEGILARTLETGVTGRIIAVDPPDMTIPRYFDVVEGILTSIRSRLETRRGIGSVSRRGTYSLRRSSS